MKKNINLAILGGFGFLALIYAIGAIGYRTDCYQIKNRLDAQLKQDRNNYDKMVNAVIEAAQVSSEYADQFRSSLKDTITGRYGVDGSKALFQMIKEHNPTIDPSITNKLMSMVEANRNSFEANQTQFIDIQNTCKDLHVGYRSVIYGIVITPPSCEGEQYEIVTSARTQEVFRTHTAEPIDIFGKKK